MHKDVDASLIAVGSSLQLPASRLVEVLSGPRRPLRVEPHVPVATIFAEYLSPPSVVCRFRGVYLRSNSVAE